MTREEAAMIHPQITGADARVSRVVCPLCHGAAPTLRQVGRFSAPEYTECPACDGVGVVFPEDVADIRARYGEPLDGAA